MRLRLRVERNGLPPTQVIWPVKDPKATIARLLHLVDEVLPLEADSWGLEDYSVSVSGYECLHYHELQAVCRDEEEVVIKPLQYVDVRARTLTGRDQIAADGRHLKDGIPFGRPLLKAPVRPEVRIPPRKKRRLEDRVNGEQVEEGAKPLMLMEHGEELGDEDDDEEDDEDFGVVESEEDSASDSSSDSSSTSSSSDEESDSENSGSDDSSSSTDTSESDDTSSDDSDEHWNGIPASAPPTPKKKSAIINGSKTDKTEMPPTGSKRKRQSDDDDAEAESGHETKEAKLPSLPYEGSKDTKTRNQRRRDAKKLKHLKEVQVLSPDATMRDLHQWKGTNPSSTAAADADADEVTEARPLPNASFTDASQRETTSTETIDHQPPVKSKKGQKKGEAKSIPNSGAIKTFEQHRAELMSAIATGAVDAAWRPGSKKGPQIPELLLQGDIDDEPPQELSSKQQISANQNVGAEEQRVLQDGTAAGAEQAVQADVIASETSDSNATAMVLPAVARRSRLDLAGSQRLLYGSLGVRVPKTQEEKDRIQKKLAERPRRNVVLAEQEVPVTEATNTDVPVPEMEDGETSEAWKDKIILSAVECCDEGVALSTPPFPFYQRWDANVKKKKAGKRINGTYMDGAAKKRKRGKREPEFVESYDKYNQDGYGDALNYDEEDAEEEYWEDGALLDEHYEEEEAEDGAEVEEAEETEEADDGFPELPTNVDDLPVLKHNEAQVGDFMAFTELACDKSTKWQPTMKTRVAQLVEKSPDDETCIFQLSKRDAMRKFFDNEGNRVYSKFEMPSDDEEGDGEQEGRREMSWSELGDVKLVARPERGADVNEE